MGAYWHGESIHAGITSGSTIDWNGDSGIIDPNPQSRFHEGKSWYLMFHDNTCVVDQVLCLIGNNQDASEGNSPEDCVEL